jgi:hypothetical protein
MLPRLLPESARPTRSATRIARTAAAAGLVLGLLALIATPALAQRAGRKAANPARRLAHLTERLHLSEEQQGRIRPILEDEAGELESAVDEARSSGDRGALREQIRAIRRRGDQRIAAELDDQQRQSFEKLRREQRERADQRKQQRKQPRKQQPGAGKPPSP